MSALVVDASAALALVVGETGREEVQDRLRDRVLSGERILAPALFWLEIVNVLARRYGFPPEAVVEAVYELEQTGIATAEVGRPGVLAVIDAIGRSGLTAYDAAYLVLAESSDAQLLTADAALARAAGNRAILVGDERGVAEGAASYTGDPPWSRWKGAAAYLADLRRAV